MHISFAELVCRAAKQMFTDQARFSMYQGHDILELVAEPKSSAGLIQPSASPQTTAQRLVEQPAVEHQIDAGIGCFHRDSVQDVIPLIIDSLPSSFDLPLRLPDAAVEPTVGFPIRSLAAEEGVLFADHACTVPASGGRQALLDILEALEPGVTEITLHPAVDTAELRAATSDWASRSADLALLVDDVEVAAAVAGAGATPIGYRQLREAMRSTTRS